MVGAARQLELRSGPYVGRADGYELDLALAIREAVALFVRAMERRREIVLQRHGQLERLAFVAEVRLPLARKLACVAQRHEIRAHAIAPLLGSDEAERREHARDIGHEHRPNTELL